MSNCLSEKEGFKNIVKLFEKFGVKKEDAEDFAFRLGIATNSVFLEPSDAYQYYLRIHSGDNAKEVVKKEEDVSKEEISKGNGDSIEITSGTGTSVDDTTGQLILNSPDGIRTPIKEEYKGKLIYAQSGTGKTSICDNVDVIDGDFIIAQYFGCNINDAGKKLKEVYSGPKDKINETLRQISDKTKEYIRQGKTVVTPNKMFLDGKYGVKADVVIINESAELSSERTKAEDRDNKFEDNIYHQRQIEAANDFATKNQNVEIHRLTKEQHLSDIILTDPSFNFIDKSIASEIAEIKERSIKNGTFMKAPNGKPTNLTEEQWLLVRTKAFKEWFGDWEKFAEVNEPNVFDNNKSNEKINIYAGTNENADLSNFAKRPFYLLQYFISDNNYQGVDSGIIYKSPKSEKTLNDWILDVLSHSNLLGTNNTSPVIVNSVENLFQAFKVLYADENEYFENLNNDKHFKLSESGRKLFLDILNSSPYDARRKGKYIKNLDRTSWDRDSSYLMKNIIKSSFIKNPQALQRLISTGNATLTHTQDKGKWGTEFPKLLMEVREELSKENDMGLPNNQSTPKYYEGNITPDANTIFVFGSNPEGRHSDGAAKVAKEKFGAIYGQGEGLQGNSYAIPTKDLQKAKNTKWYRPGEKEELDVKEWYKTYSITEVKNHPLNAERTISPSSIIGSIKKLYEVAIQNPTKQFKVSNYPIGHLSLNGYLGEEMIQMFKDAGEIPSNIIFSKEWIDTGMFNDSQRQTSQSVDALKIADKTKDDNVSKVVDENGEPLVVYHSSDSLFTNFSHEFGSKKTGAKDSKELFFFMKDKDGSSWYSIEDWLHSNGKSHSTYKIKDLLYYIGDILFKDVEYTTEDNIIIYENGYEDNIGKIYKYSNGVIIETEYEHDYVKVSDNATDEIKKTVELYNDILEYESITNESYDTDSGTYLDLSIPREIQEKIDNFFIRPFFLNIKEMEDASSVNTDSNKKTSLSEYSSHLDKDGFVVHDTIDSKYQKKLTDIYAVRHPNQIKSADSNRGTFSKYNDNIYFKKQGRELYTSELMALVPSLKGMNTIKDRQAFKKAMDKISSDYGVQFEHITETEVWEKQRWICNDQSFIDFVKFYSNSPSKKFRGTPAKWIMWQKLNNVEIKTKDNEEDSDIDTKYVKSQYQMVKIERMDMFMALTKDRKIKDRERLAELFADIRNLENPEISKQDRDVLLKAQKEISYWSSRFPSITDIVTSDDTITIDDLTVNNEVKEVSESFVDQLSTNLGVTSVFIDESEANEILNKIGIKYESDSHVSFYFNGTTYFIKGKFDKATAIHEFSHPLMQSIRQNNRELFNNLYRQLKESSAWNTISSRLLNDYKELTSDSDAFMEEALVFAMEYAHNDTFKDDHLFKKVLDRIVYALKQLFRKAFGEDVDVSKLSLDTTIGDLELMLENNVKFDLKLNTATDKDVVRFKKNELELRDEAAKVYTKGDISNLNSDSIMSSFNSSIGKTFEVLREYRKQLETNGDLERLKELQTNLYDTGELDEVIHDLKKSVFDLDGKFTIIRVTPTTSDEDIYEARMLAFANSIGYMEKMTKQINDEANLFASKPELSQEDVRAIYSYYNNLNMIKKLIESIESDLNNITSGNPVQPDILRSLLGRIKGNIDTATNTINNMYVNIATEVIQNEMEPINQNILTQFHKRIAELQGNPRISQKFIDDEYIHFTGMTKDEYDAYNKLEPFAANGTLSGSDLDKFEKLKFKSRRGLIKTKYMYREYILGEMGDVNFLNAKFESYMYSTDPIIGGFAKFHKRQTEIAYARTRKKYADFQQKVAPLIKKSGVGKIGIGGLGKLLGFRDKIFVSDKDGERQSESWTFLNQFKDYRYEEGRLRNNQSKAYDKYIRERNDANLQAYLIAKDEYDEFKYIYMNSEYVDEYNEAIRSFYKSDAGKRVLDKREAILDEIEYLEGFIMDEYTVDPSALTGQENAIAQIAILKKQLRQLASKYDEFGNLKSADEVEEAEVLSEFNKKVGKFKETITDDKSFDRDFLLFRQSILDQGIAEGSDKYNELIDQWLQNKMTYGTDPLFNNARQAALEEIARCMEAAGISTSDDWLKIFGHVAGSKDIEGHINPSLLTAAEIDDIKKLQELMASSSSGMSVTPELQKAFSMYEMLIDRKPTKYYLDSLQKALDDCGITQSDYSRIFGVLTLEEIANEIVSPGFDKTKLASFSFMAGSSFISTGSTTLLDWFDQNHFTKKITKTGVEIRARYYFNDVVVPSDPSYELTHNVIDPTTGVIVASLKGQIEGIYSKSVVKDEYKRAKIVGETVDNKGNWLPKSRSQMALVDSSLVNEDNTDTGDGGRFRYRFINEKYEEFCSNPDNKALLDAFVEQHLENQTTASDRNKLYLDMPRYVKDNAETIAQVSNVGVSETIRQLLRRIKQFFQGSPDDFENGYANYEESFDVNQNLVALDHIDDRLGKIPVGGLYRVDADDCSTNIARTMWRYASDCDLEESLRQASPFVKAIETAINNSSIKGAGVDKNLLESTGIIDRLAHNGENRNLRKQQMDAFIETNYQGITSKGIGARHRVLMKIANLLMGRASFSFFAFNVPSALKNSYGIKFQALLESTASNYMNPLDLERGNRWSLGAMSSLALSGNYNMNAPKSFERMIIEQFDMAQDTAQDTFMDPLWRSAGTDILEGKLFTAPRKWLEQQATYQVGAGILFHNKVSYTDPKTRRTCLKDYMDVLEERDGELRLKENCDIRFDTKSNYYTPEVGDTIESIASKFNIPGDEGKEYIKRMVGDDSKLQQKIANIQTAQAIYNRDMLRANTYLTGDELIAKRLEIESALAKAISQNQIKLENEKYTEVRNSIHQVNNDLGGAYAKFDQPDLQRYFLYKITFYLRRYFTTMFCKRFRWRERINPGLGMQSRGYYITAVDTLLKVCKSKGAYMTMMSPQEKASLIKTTTEALLLAAIPFLAQLVFGYDPDDDERNKKLREKSGALPLPFTSDDENRSFNLPGFLELHALHLLLQIRQENEQFLPGAGGLKQLESMLDIKSVMFGPTLDQSMLIMGDLKDLAFGEDGAGYYSRNIGPYEWQQKGDSKLWNHLMKMAAITGTSADPALAIQNYETNRAKVRR